MSLFKKRKEDEVLEEVDAEKMSSESNASEEYVADVTSDEESTTESPEESSIDEKSVKESESVSTEASEELESEDSSPMDELDVENAGAASVASGVAEDIKSNSTELEEDLAEEVSETLSKKERKALEKEAKKKAKKSKKKGAAEGEVELDEVDTVIKHTNAEAHRYVEYYPPGKVSQTFIMAGVEMKRISKTGTYLAILLLGAIMYSMMAVPMISSRLVMLYSMFNISNAYLLGPNAAMAFCLAILPFFGAYYCSIKMASTVPEEFKDRTIFLHFALPVSKGAIYVGKFIANYISVILMVCMGYGVAFLVAYNHYNVDFGAIYVLKSFSVAILATFALSSMIYCMSVSKKKGHGMRGFLLILIPVSLIYTILVVCDSEIIAYFGIDFLDQVLDKVELALAYAPMLGFDLAIQQLGGTGINFLGIDNTVSFTFLPSMFGETISFDDVDIYVALLVYFLWGMFFMLRGIRKFKRRQL